MIGPISLFWGERGRDLWPVLLFLRRVFWWTVRRWCWNDETRNWSGELGLGISFSQWPYLVLQLAILHGNMETRKKLVYGPYTGAVFKFCICYFVKVTTRNFSVFMKQCPDSSQWWTMIKSFILSVRKKTIRKGFTPNFLGRVSFPQLDVGCFSCAVIFFLQKQSNEAAFLPPLFSPSEKKKNPQSIIDVCYALLNSVIYFTFYAWTHEKLCQLARFFPLGRCSKRLRPEAVCWAVTRSCTSGLRRSQTCVPGPSGPTFPTRSPRSEWSRVI